MANLPSKLKKLFRLKTLLLLVFLGGFLMVLAILAMPFWLGWALRQAPPEIGLSFDAYAMDGYGRFTLEGVKIEQPNATILLDRINAPSPLNWLRLALWSEDGEPYVHVNQAKVEIRSSPTSDVKQPTPSRRSPDDLQSAMDQLETLLSIGDQWLPKADVSELTILWEGREIRLNQVSWDQRQLVGTGMWSAYPNYLIQITLNLKKGEPSLTGSIPALSINFLAQLEDVQPNWEANGRISYLENMATFSMVPGKDSWIPQSASWNFTDWKLDLTQLGLEFDPYYQTLGFSLSGTWQDGEAKNSLSGHLYPPEETNNTYLIPVDFKSEVSGNLEKLTVSQFSLEAPGILAASNEPIVYDFQQNLISGDLRFDMDLDLSSLNIEDLEGHLAGLVAVSTTNGEPKGNFDLKGTDVGYQQFAFDELDLEADLDWPLVSLNQGKARLSTGSYFDSRGVVDIQSQSLSNGYLEGFLDSDTLEPFLPEGIELDGVNFKTNLNGSLAALEHKGDLQVNRFETDLFQPVAAEITWSAKGLQLEKMDLTASRDEVRIELIAAGNLSSEEMSWRIDEMVLRTAEQNELHLAHPADLKLTPRTPVAVALSDFRLSGDGTSLSLEGQLIYPERGDLEFEAKELDISYWAKTWLKHPLPELELISSQGTAAWDQGPLEFDLSLDGAIHLEGNRLLAKGHVNSQENGISFSELQLADAKGPWIEISGLAPVQILPASEKGYVIHREDPIALNFATSESKNWLDWLSGLTPIKLESFDSKVSLHGSLSRLEGNFDLGMTTREDAKEHGMPSTRIQTRGEINQSLLTLTSMQVAVLEEQFSVSGSLDLPDSVLDLLDDHSKEIPWEATTFDLKIPPSKLSPMRYFFPQLLSTGGEVEANLKGGLETGIAGYLRIKGLNTKSVFPFGALRSLSADLDFNKSQATLNNISGYIGREPVTIAGSLDYRNWKKPIFNFSISGEDVPLVRKPGLLLRSDLDLTIDNSASEETIVSGQVVLKDGLYLLNRNTLFAGGSGGGRSANTRPPFFAVDIPPVSEWKLDVALRGDRFIRVRTPAADGALSLDMKLQGKLKEPFATGQLNYDYGNIYFPFASFKVDYGLAELAVGNPYTPMLEIIGTSRRFGYDLTVEITGSAYDPQIQFISSPPLSSEQIMLMVMTGNNPDGDFDYTSTQKVSRLGTYLSKGLFASSGSDSNFFNRLSLTYGENLSEQGKETLEIEYRLDDRFHVVGEYDEYDFWNAGIVWRAVQRKLKDKEEDKQE